jgi:nitroimidazol reductase NimA-like FMN-containing flavoprotein (pyridoxamine 5'-phosphate oxidase superfamily)
VKRHPERGAYDRATIDAILDEALICHLGFVVEGRPFVIPTIHARDGDTLYIHGSPGSRMLRAAKEGVDICVTVTLLDGLVLARSVYNHSMNYRSVVVLGRARELTDADENSGRSNVSSSTWFRGAGTTPANPMTERSKARRSWHWRWTRPPQRYGAARPPTTMQTSSLRSGPE